jgi:hypothetical protein
MTGLEWLGIALAIPAVTLARWYGAGIVAFLTLLSHWDRDPASKLEK